MANYMVKTMYYKDFSMGSSADQKLTEIFRDSASSALFTAGDFRLGRLLFNQQAGLGGTIVNHCYPYGSFVVFMKPAVFLSLASSGIVHNSRDFIAEGIERYAGTNSFPLAAPYLMVDFSSDPPRITGHEGRNRMRAIKSLDIADDIPVLIQPSDAMPLEKIGAGALAAFFEGAINQDKRPVNGPLFSRAQLGERLFTAQPV